MVEFPTKIRLSKYFVWVEYTVARACQVRLITLIVNPYIRYLDDVAGKLTQSKTIVSALMFFLQLKWSQTRQSSCPSHLLQTRFCEYQLQACTALIKHVKLHRPLRYLVQCKILWASNSKKIRAWRPIMSSHNNTENFLTVRKNWIVSAIVTTKRSHWVLRSFTTIYMFFIAYKLFSTTIFRD